MNRSPVLATISLLIADPVDRRLLAEFLQQTGYQVQILQKADLNAAGVNAVLCITDEQAARQHGRALLALKRQLQPLYFPVLMTLGGNQPATGWLRTGFDDVLRLPLKKDDLLARLEAFLRLRQHSEDLQTEGDLRYRSTFDLAPVGIVHTTLDGIITLVNPCFGAMLQLTAEAPLPGQQLISLVAGEDRLQMDNAIAALLAGAVTSMPSFDLRFWRRDKSLLWTSVTLSLSRGVRGLPGHVLALIEDISERKQAQKHLAYLAHYDSLTGLPNRVLFYDRLKQALLQAERSNWIVGVMFIDLDHFKNVNDTLGHAAGDTLLQKASLRIVDSLRTNDTVGRLGGDEFGVFLPDVTSQQDVAMLAAKITQALSAPFLLGGAEIFITPSIGITLYPLDGNSADELVSSADTAMYRAKELGRNSHQFFTPHMTALMSARARLENGLRKALERQELSLHYQPQIDMVSGRVIGVEALLRWQHPEMGMISPAQFIPTAEETGLIIPIGAWVLQAACTQNKAWQRVGIAPIVMAVNLSARQFKQHDVAALVRDVLQETGMEGRYLELEVTEGIVMDNTEALIATMVALKELGVRLSLDDFGTGYSNLAYLKRFPLDTIKIDRSFISGIGQGDDAVIAATVITLGHHLNLKVIAEGVETQTQLDVLQQLGCDHLQGYLCSQPLSAEAVTALLWQHQPK